MLSVLPKQVSKSQLTGTDSLMQQTSVCQRGWGAMTPRESLRTESCGWEVVSDAPSGVLVVRGSRCVRGTTGARGSLINSPIHFVSLRPCGVVACSLTSRSERRSIGC